LRDLEPRALGRALPDPPRRLRRLRGEGLGARAVSADAALDAVHLPVLVEAVVRWLAPVPPGTWIVDGTVGLGGHAAALLEASTDSRLLGLDRDGETLARAAERLARFGSRCVLRHSDFRHIDREARACGAAPAHAV